MDCAYLLLSLLCSVASKFSRGLEALNIQMSYQFCANRARPNQSTGCGEGGGTLVTKQVAAAFWLGQLSLPLWTSQEMDTELHFHFVCTVHLYCGIKVILLSKSYGSILEQVSLLSQGIPRGLHRPYIISLNI